MALIELEGVKKTFGSKVALDDVNLSIESGEIFGFLGPNGAGKSTAIRCIMGFIYPNVGKITVDSREVSSSHARYRDSIGYVPSDLHLNDNWTGKQHIDFILETRKITKDYQELVDKLGIDLSQKAKHLSTGNRQKLGFILALVVEPKILILDEPTKGLDPILQETMYEILIEFKEDGGCVFFSSHNLNEVERICDRVAIIRAGKIVANETMESLRQKHVHIVDVSFKGDIEIPNLSSFGDVQTVSNQSVKISIEGDINPFLAKITQYEISDIKIDHASLEDIFLHFYEET